MRELINVATIGGIESGNFNYQCLISIKRVTSTESKPIIMATNIPLVPK